MDTSEQARIAMQALADQAMAQLADTGERADAEIATLRENVARSVALIDEFRSERDQARRAQGEGAPGTAGVGARSALARFAGGERCRPIWLG